MQYNSLVTMDETIFTKKIEENGLEVDIPLGFISGQISKTNAQCNINIQLFEDFTNVEYNQVMTQKLQEFFFALSEMMSFTNIEFFEQVTKSSMMSKFAENEEKVQEIRSIL